MNFEQQKTENLRVKSVTRLSSPRDLKEKFALNKSTKKTVSDGRAAIRSILNGEDSRMLVITGPCSIHDPAAALDYAKRLAKLKNEVEEKYLLIMRVYFEKPRTTIGWKGFINDPYLDDSCDMQHGLNAARELMLNILALDLPIATEILEPIIPQYMSDLVSWAAIGARTIESQTHREMTSGLSMPVGLKNATDGSVQRAIDALISSQSPHSFLGIDLDGHSSIIKTTGNPNTHLVLRGGGGKPNYYQDDVLAATNKLKAAKLPGRIVVDCSHANCSKIATRQKDVWNDLLEQRKNGKSPIVGAMLESFIKEGNQPISDSLTYGLSITDPCLSWEMTESILKA